MLNDTLCPFSKPILGLWCECRHAVTYDRCSGKMLCTREEDLLPSCRLLVEIFKEKSRFVLGQNGGLDGLTHAQLMKIRCGGLQGMQRVLRMDDSRIPDVRNVIDQVESEFGELAAFPFNEIMPDIKAFSHRKKRKS